MNDYNFGNFVCCLREEKGMTQAELADMLGVTAAAVSKWENGVSKSKIEILFSLAKILGVTPEELMEGRYLNGERVSKETAKRIREEFEYLTKVSSYQEVGVKVRRITYQMRWWEMDVVCHKNEDGWCVCPNCTDFE